MNTEKIEKLKKSLSNSKIPADLKPKIEAEIKRLEDLDAKQSEPKEEEKEVKPVAKKTTTRKPRTTKTVAKKTSTAKPSQTSKPKRTAMSVAKEIRKEGESWKDAMARASKTMKEKSKTATKDVESELEKLTKLVRSKKELKGQVGRTNLLIDAKRKAKPMGRRVSKDGNVYYENRANRTDRGTYGKYHLAEGGYLTDPNFGNFQNTMFADGGGIPNNYEGKTPEQVWNSLSVKQREHFLLDHYYVDEDEFFQQQTKWLDSEDKKMIDYYSNKTWNKLSAEVKKAFTSHVKLGQYAKGGGIRRKNGQTYDYGRVWTKDHNEFDKGADHEVNYRRKKLAKGGAIKNQYAGRTPEDIWNSLSYTQKEHFLSDHLTPNNFHYFEKKGLNKKELARVSWENLAFGVKKEFYEHVNMGQYAKGGGIRRKNGQTYDYGRVWTNDHNQFDKGADHEVNYRRKRFELGGNVVTDLAGHTGGSLGTGDPSMLDAFSNTAYTGLVGETGAMSSGEMFAYGGGVKSNSTFRANQSSALRYANFEDGSHINLLELNPLKRGGLKHKSEYKYAISVSTKKDGQKVLNFKNLENAENIFEDLVNERKKDIALRNEGKTNNYELGGGLPDGVSQSYMITESLGNPAQHFAKGGGVGKMYYHILEYGDYGNIGYQGYYDTLEEAQKQVKKLSDYFPNQTFEIFADKSRKEPPITTMAKGGGIRMVGGREYPTGRNWTNDHEHTNKGEEHEVNYTRKGKFLGLFAKGGGVKGDKYDGKTEKIVEELKKLKGGLDNKAPYVYQRDGYIYVSAEEGDNYADYDNYLYIDEKLEDFADKYDTYWDWENAGAIILVPLSDEYSKGGKMAKGGGVDDESPKIYVADLEAYNNGRLSGVWLDLADYNDADELMEAIQDFLKTSGGEEYAIHDVEYIPSNMYSEYMGQKDFEELYEMIDLAKDKDLPLSVVQEVISQYDASAVDEFYGRYDDAEDFAQQLVDDTGIESFTDFEYYLYITDTDRRLLSQDMADSYVDDIKDEDGGNRLIEEAGLDVEEYEEAESDRQEEMLDEAREIVYDEYYNTWFEGLSDPYYFLVEEQGMYDAESFANANFVRIDFEKLADALEQDYTFIYDGGSLYVFNIR